VDMLKLWTQNSTLNSNRQNKNKVVNTTSELKEILEVRNEGDRSFWVCACRSISGRLYVHIGTERKQLHGKIKKVLPNDYEIIEVNTKLHGEPIL